MNSVRQHINRCLGVSLAKPRVALSAASPRSFLAVGFPLQSLTRNVPMLLPIILIAPLMSSCSHEDALTERSWIIDKGAYLGNSIAFRSTDAFQFADANGNVNAYLDFAKDGSIGIPGINCPNMRGLWRLENDSIVLTLDSARYRSIEIGVAQWRKEQLAKGDSTIALNDAPSQPSELDSGVFTAAMEVFKHPFAYEIKRETLILQSKTTRIVAHKDRTIDKMFEGL